MIAVGNQSARSAYQFTTFLAIHLGLLFLVIRASTVLPLIVLLPIAIADFDLQLHFVVSRQFVSFVRILACCTQRLPTF